MKHKLELVYHKNLGNHVDKTENLWNLIIKYELPFESSDGYGVGLGLGLLDNAGHNTSRTTSKIMILAFMKINIIRKIFHFIYNANISKRDNFCIILQPIFLLIFLLS